MSGILLPGQENEPKREGKIELPSGYGSAQRKPADLPSEAQAPSTKEAPQDQPATSRPEAAQSGPSGGQAGRRGSDLLFPPQGVQVKCPSCGTPYVAPVFRIIDLGVNPELRSLLLSGQINVGVCQSCGAGGQLNAPLMIHDPENQFLGVYVPMDGAGDRLQQEKTIGDLTRALMSKIPAKEQRGYMLQPKEYIDFQRLMEKLWEFEGVTPEMLRRQRDQSDLLQRLLGLVKDNKALDLAVERNKTLIDREFFTMLDQIFVLARSQAGSGELESLRLLREKLIERTEAGQEVKKQAERIQAMLNRVGENTSREEVLEMVLEAWAEEDAERLVGTFAMVTGIAADYEFLMMLAQRIDQAENDAERESLEDLRTYLVGIQQQIVQQQQQLQQEAARDAQEFLQEVLQATNTEAVLREHIDEVDETFLALLAEHIRRMEQAGSTGAAHRLTQVYEQSLAILQEQMPEDMQFLNRLVSAKDDAAVRELLRNNRSLVTKDFISAMKTFEQQTRESGHRDLADRIKSVRAQAALML